MRIKLILLVLSLVYLTSCSDSESNYSTLNVSQSSFTNVSASGETLTLDISSNMSWTISSNSQWCTPNLQNGTNDGKITLTISPNYGQKERTTNLTITAEEVTKIVTIAQNAISLQPSDLTTYHFQIPVIFHVLYKNQSNKNQYVPVGRIKTIMNECNKYYQNAFGNSTNINLELVLANEDPNEKALAEPGVNRVLWDSPEMDCIEFMSLKNQSNINLLWDTDKYINIVLYTFASNSDGTILGISQFPYTVMPDKLEGLAQLDFLPTHHNLAYPHCISINNKFINSEFNILDNFYNPTDVAMTIAHELGHYLGLYHAFSQSNNENESQCKDTDYCTDTPTYDREAYMQYMENYIISKGNKLGWNDYLKLMERKDCLTLTTSTPNNVMDYSISWCNRFTQQQKDRIRYVLTHSPLVPGPKVKRTTTRSIATPTPLPMRLIQ